MKIRDGYARYDAERKFALPGRDNRRSRRHANAATCCKGAIKPWQCRVFGTECTPETPLGALMVSSEGSCAAYYQYGGVKAHKEVA